MEESHKKKYEIPLLSIIAMEAKEKVGSLSSGNDFLMILSERGILYSLGSNAYGQLGLGDYASRAAPTPLAVFGSQNEKVLEVSCGFSHVLCRTSFGRGYSWGGSHCFQLFTCHKASRNSPFLIPVNSFSPKKDLNIKSITAGFASSYLLLEDNNMYVAGKVGFGILARPSRYPYEAIFFDGKMNQDFAPVKITANWSKMLTTLTLTVLDFRNTDNIKYYKEKLAQTLQNKWRQGDLLPHTDDNLAKYLHPRSFLRDKVQKFYIDIGAGSTRNMSRNTSQNKLTRAPFSDDVSAISGPFGGHPKKEILVNEIVFDKSGKVKHCEQEAMPLKSFLKSPLRAGQAQPDQQELAAKQKGFLSKFEPEGQRDGQAQKQEDDFERLLKQEEIQSQNVLTTFNNPAAEAGRSPISKIDERLSKITKQNAPNRVSARQQANQGGLFNDKQ